MTRSAASRKAWRSRKLMAAARKSVSREIPSSDGRLAGTHGKVGVVADLGAGPKSRAGVAPGPSDFSPREDSTFFTGPFGSD